MCTYITATLLSASDPAPVKQIFHSKGKRLALLSHPHIEEQIGPTRKYYLTTRGVCDCGTVLGSAHEAVLTPLEREQAADLDSYAYRLRERNIERRRKRGWSEAKIKRWLAQKDRSTRRKREALVHSEISDQDRLQNWCNLVKSVLAVTPELGLLIHSYDGALTDSFELKGLERYRSASITPKRMKTLPFDHLCVFQR